MTVPTGAEGQTVRLHRALRAPRERIYRAFLEPEAMVKWCAPHGFTAAVHEIDVRVGGRYRMSFTNFATGTSHSFGGSYMELSPHDRIVYCDQFDDPDLPGRMITTIHLRELGAVTELELVQSGLPGAMPLEYVYLGWQESLSMLAQLVEPEIPDMK